MTILFSAATFPLLIEDVPQQQLKARVVKHQYPSKSQNENQQMPYLVY